MFKKSKGTVDCEYWKTGTQKYELHCPRSISQIAGKLLFPSQLMIGVWRSGILMIIRSWKWFGEVVGRLLTLTTTYHSYEAENWTEIFPHPVRWLRCIKRFKMIAHSIQILFWDNSGEDEYISLTMSSMDNPDSHGQRRKRAYKGRLFVHSTALLLPPTPRGVKFF